MELDLHRGPTACPEERPQSTLRLPFAGRCESIQRALWHSSTWLHANQLRGLWEHLTDRQLLEQLVCERSSLTSCGQPSFFRPGSHRAQHAKQRSRSRALIVSRNRAVEGRTIHAADDVCLPLDGHLKTNVSSRVRGLAPIENHRSVAAPGKRSCATFAHRRHFSSGQHSVQWQ
jgi:hypothetical protein